MSILGDAELALFDDLAEDAGGTLTVTRGVGSPVSLTFIKGRSNSERFGDTDAMYATSVDNDFIFKLTDYVTEVGSEPETTDFINWTDEGGTARRYQVGVDGAERHYDPIGQFGYLIRVHATEIST